MIRHGSTLSSTPEFTSFHRRYQAVWGQILQVVKQLEQLMTEFHVPLAVVNGTPLAERATADDRPLAVDELLALLVNGDAVAPKFRKWTRFKGQDASDEAACAIQSVWRMCRQKRLYKVLLRRHRSARTIAIAYRLYLKRMDTRSVVARKWEDDLRQWRARQAVFIKRWPRIKERRRIVVHIASAWRTRSQRQVGRIELKDDVTHCHEAQLSRLFELADPNVEVVYVSAYPISDEIQRYYVQLLQLRGVPSLQTRLKFLCPEPQAMLVDLKVPLATSLYYSPKCLSRIRQLTQGHSSYIVPNLVGPDDLKVAVFLKLPILAAEPSIARNISSASGSKRVFTEALVGSPIGAHDIHAESDLYTQLSELIIGNLGVQRWIIKLNDESGGRGISFFEPAKLKVFSEIVQEHQTSNKFSDPDALTFNQERLQSALSQRLQFIVRLVHPELYEHGWRSFVECIELVGACIEACPQSVAGSPSVNLFIEPDGNITVLSTHDQLFSRPYVHVGSVFPQSSCNPATLRQTALQVAAVCSARGVLGFVGIDFIVAVNDSTKQHVLLAVDLNLHVTTTQLTFWLFDYLAAGKLSEAGDYSIPAASAADASGGMNSRSSSNASLMSRQPSLADLSKQLQNRLSTARCYAALDNVVIPSLSGLHYQAFFSLCRLEGISFDMATRSGSAFQLADSITAGTLCVVCTADSQLAALNALGVALHFLKAKVGIRDDEAGKSNLNDLIVTIKAITNGRA
ncbi:hypothetical protein PBRA_003392 [Plasmodiophora brassicae]|nr:hypothetical protein PBRA_003392 [Plasmodiophora brassicae]